MLLWTIYIHNILSHIFIHFLRSAGSNIFELRRFSIELCRWRVTMYARTELIYLLMSIVHNSCSHTGISNKISVFSSQCKIVGAGKSFQITSKYMLWRKECQLCTYHFPKFTQDVLYNLLVIYDILSSLLQLYWHQLVATRLLNLEI